MQFLCIKSFQLETIFSLRTLPMLYLLLFITNAFRAKEMKEHLFILFVEL